MILILSEYGTLRNVFLRSEEISRLCLSVLHKRIHYEALLNFRRILTSLRLSIMHFTLPCGGGGKGVKRRRRTKMLGKALAGLRNNIEPCAFLDRTQ